MMLKYQDEVAGIEHCPPKHAAPCERVAFRFVHADRHDLRSYLPPAKMNPRRQFEGDAIPCGAWALSLFDSRASAEAFRRSRTLRRANFFKLIGNDLATGVIGSQDGLATGPNQEGHFDLHEAVGLDLALRFQLVGPLST